MRLSVVIPCFDYERYVGLAIESVLANDRSADQIIVVDDGSSDRSAEVAGAFPEVTLVRKENGGMASALNRGIAEADGDVVVLLDADDLMATGRLGWIERAFLDDPEVVMAWHPLVIEDDAGAQHGCCPADPLPAGDLVPGILDHGLPSFAVTSGIAVHRRALDAVGPVPEDEFRNFAESWFVRTVPFVGPVAATQEPLGTYRSHSGSDMRSGAAADPDAMAAKIRRRLDMADTEHRTLADRARLAGHDLPVDRLRAADRVYRDLVLAHARLSEPSRSGAMRRIRSSSPESLPVVDRVRHAAVGAAYLALPRTWVARHQLVRGGEPNLDGATRLWSAAYWRLVALRRRLS